MEKTTKNKTKNTAKNEIIKGILHLLTAIIAFVTAYINIAWNEDVSFVGYIWLLVVVLNVIVCVINFREAKKINSIKKEEATEK